MGFVYPVQVEESEDRRVLRVTGRVFDVNGRSYLAQDSGRETTVYPLTGAKWDPTDDGRLFIEPGLFFQSDKTELTRLVQEVGMSTV